MTAGVGRLYYINSLGAVFGVALGGFYLVPVLGLDTSIRASAIVNLILGVAFLAWDRRLQRSGLSLRPHLDHTAGSSDGLQFSVPIQRMVLVVIGISGAISMLYEVAWTRLLSLVLG